MQCSDVDRIHSNLSQHRNMALLIAGAVTAAAVGVAGATAGLVKRFMDRFVVVANDTPHPISVAVEHPQGKSQSVIEAGESMKFTVSNNKSISIKVKRSTKPTYEAEVCDYDYSNFIVRKATTGDLVLVRAKKFKIWEAEPCKTHNKHGDFVKASSLDLGQFY
ncbi:uncharacterized protein LOC121417575 [Lytechinus variegatus]|uniref:uncharacterized protein LOC121417575 n=1 Tax=Lytechinus variegatus TaxID=7654 RepID=UPI001BB20646|nr:uncharacterized protein LOC121417575 [Lytechinus variegatus]